MTLLQKNRMTFLPVILAVLFVISQCSKTDHAANGQSGTIYIIYDSDACECVRKQGETILRQIDSLKTADPFIDQQFTFRCIDWFRDRKTADAVLDRCNDPLIPVVLIEDPQEQVVFNFSFEFDPVLFHQILKDLKEIKSN